MVYAQLVLAMMVLAVGAWQMFPHDAVVRHAVMAM